MKKQFIVLIVLSSLIASGSFAGEMKCSSANDADEYFVHGEKALAWDCIEKVIKTKPDVRAHYTKGKFALLGGDLSLAKAKFSADDVKTKYGEEIFQLYKGLGDKNITNGNVTAAGDMYIEAVGYKAAAKTQIASDMFEKGKASAKRGYFDIARRLDETLTSKIADYIYGQAQNEKTAAKRIEVIGEAGKFDKRYEKEYQQESEKEGRGHLELAKNFAKQVGKDALTAKEKAEAKRWLGEAVVEKELPEIMDYRPGTYVLSLKAGEQSPFWIMFEGYDYSLSSKDYKYKLVYNDGTVVEDGPNVSYPRKTRAKFRIVAITDQQEIKMEFK